MIANRNNLRAIHGFRPEKVTSTKLKLLRGSLADSNGRILYQRNDDTLVIDISTTGANGLDTGTVADNTQYFVYIIRNKATRALGGLFSIHDAIGNVTMPSGWEFLRKLNYGFVYKSAAPASGGWNGIPDVHIECWPATPIVRLTLYNDEVPHTAFRALSAGTATSFTNVNLATIIPKEARMVHLCAHLSASGSTGTAFLRSSSSTGDSHLIGTALTTYPLVRDISLRTTSVNVIDYKVTGGGSLTLYVKGYSMTEDG